MSEMNLIAPPSQVRVSFALKPVYDALTSLMMISADLPGLDEWVENVAALLSPDQHEVNKWTIDCAGICNRDEAWPSVETWMDELEQIDPVVLRDKVLKRLINKAASILGVDKSDLPDAAQLASDRSAYMSLIERTYAHADKTLDPACCETEYEMLQDPVTRKERIVTHLRAMWEQHLAKDWEHNVPMLRASIAAFRALDYRNKTVAEIVRIVTDREMPREWEDMLAETRDIVFIPTAHIGPYLYLPQHGEKAQIVFRARIPEGSAIRSPALSRSELVMRLGALADHTRLGILEYIARQGEVRAQDIIAALDLSQSAASRHLRQLSTTGFLHERRCEGAKCYSLDRDRIQGTFTALQRFLQ